MKKERGEEEKEEGWQRLTLPPSHPGSTISARELNDRVRDGTGWTLTALATNTHLCCLRLLRARLALLSQREEPHRLLLPQCRLPLSALLTRFRSLLLAVTRQRPCLPA